MQQAALRDGFGFDLLSRFQDGFGPAEIDVCGREVAQGLCQVVPAQTQLGANVAIQAANSAA